MKQVQTKGIVLARTDFGEADRIITLLTPEQGKLRLMAKGVRKPKSKLAGGIELFSTSDITFIHGRGEIDTLISSRLNKYYSNIVKDIDRVQLGYELIKTLNKNTEDQPEPEYYHLLETALKALDDLQVPDGLIRTWFQAQLLKLSGHQPNLATTADGKKLEEGQKYNFDFESMSFFAHDAATYKANDIKFLRLLFSQNIPQTLAKIQNSTILLKSVGMLVQTMTQTHLRA